MAIDTETESSSDFFKYWSELAVKDPERFEHERRKEIEKVIAEAPVERRERLRRLQWRIDQERARGSNPLSSCIRLNRMMMDFIFSENGFYNALKLFTEDAPTDAPPPAKEAQVLPLFKEEQ